MISVNVRSDMCDQLNVTLKLFSEIFLFKIYYKAITIFKGFAPIEKRREL